MKTISKLTDKQIEILEVMISLGNNAILDLILERLSFSPSKQSFQFSTRALIRRGLIVKGGLVTMGETKHKRRIFTVTEKGVETYTRYRKTPTVMDFTDEGM